MQEPRKRRLGDRYDGWRLRHTQSFFSVMPHIMKRRSDSSVLFDDVVEIEQLEKYVRELRKEQNMPGFSMFHLFIAASVRMITLRPWLNRFVIGGKSYARNRLTISMTVKRTLSKDSEDVVIKPDFDGTDTVYDVYRKINEAISHEVKDPTVENDTDMVARILDTCPSWLTRAIVNVVNVLDHLGLMPKAINRLSPFHTSMYITDVGSLGIGPVYHHIYDFGTTSIFMAMGKKEMILEKQADGSVREKKVIRLRFVVDERICDGYYFSESFRSLKRLLKTPSLLEQPPESIPVDTWI